MKKSIYTGFAAFLAAALLLSGCSTTEETPNNDQAPVPVADNNDAQDGEADKAQEDEAPAENNDGDAETPDEAPAPIGEGVEAQAYMYQSSGGSAWYVLKLTNYTDKIVYAEAQVSLVNGDGNPIDRFDIDALEPGQSSVGICRVEDATSVDDVTYELEYEETEKYVPVMNDIVLEQYPGEEHVVVSVTNNSGISVQYLEAYALFFDADNNLLYAGDTYLVDNDNELKPGAKFYAQINCYADEYDHAEVYLTSRADGSESIARNPVSVSDADFEVKEYLVEGNASSVGILTYTNNSTETVEIYTTAAAKDAAGNVLGAGWMEILVLAPGETSVGHMNFVDVTGISSIEYVSNYASTIYLPVVADLSWEQKETDKGIEISVTNNGEYAASFVEAYALFMDANDNILDDGIVYIKDADDEIKPGDTQTNEILFSSEYDHVEIYLTSRGPLNN